MRILTRLDRHVAREVFVPTLLAFVVYTMLLLMNGLFKLMEQVVVHGVSGSDALRAVIIGLPNVVILTIPVSFLFGVLLAAGRMTNDNEVTALQAAGIRPAVLFRPVLFLGFVFLLLCLHLTMDVMPGSTRELRDLRIRMFASGSAIRRIEPKVFYDEMPGTLLYVEDVDKKTGNWQNVLIHRSVSPDEEQLILARRGRVVRTTATEDRKSGTTEAKDGTNGSEPWIFLEDMVNHTFLRKQPEKFLTSTVQTHAFRPESPDKQSKKVTYRGTLRELRTPDLLEQMRTGADISGESKKKTELTPEERSQNRRAAGIELNRRLAFPMACLTFGLLGLPLGIGTRSGGRGRGFLISIVVVIFYYVVNSYGEFLVLERGVPAWIGMWLPNLVLLVAGLFLAARMGRWLGERERPESLVGRLIRWWQQRRQLRLMAASQAVASGRLTGSIPIGIQRRVYGGGFPTLLDRYVFRRLFSPFLLVILSTVSLYVIGDLTDHMDEIAHHGATAPLVLAYYWNIIPKALFDVLPFGVLISVITMLTVLERHQELTALKASGVSIFRIMIPILLVAAAGVGTMWILGEYVVPSADTEASKLLNEIEGRVSTSGRSATHRNWLVGRDGRTFYTFLRYDIPSRRLIRFSMFKIDRQMRLRQHLVAPRVEFINGAWIADGGWYRNIDENGHDQFFRIDKPTEVGIVEGPTYFGQENERANQLTQSQLRQYINELEDSGYRPTALLVRWHQKFATPLSVLVLVMLALPFALKGGGGTRSSTMQGVAIALMLGVGYFILVVPLFARLGEAEFLPPYVGAWVPLLLGFLFAVNRITRIRT